MTESMMNHMPTAGQSKPILKGTKIDTQMSDTICIKSQ